MEFRQCGEQGAHRRAVAVLGRDEEGRLELAAAGETVLGEGGEHSVGSDLQQGADPVVVQSPHGVREPDGLPDVPRPVVGAERLVRGEGQAGRGADEIGPCRPEGQGRGDRAELVEHGVHVCRVEGVAGPQLLVPASLLRPEGHDVLDLVPVSGQDHGPRSVDGGDRYPGAGSEEVPHLLFGRLDGHHEAAARHGLHQTAAGRDERAGVLQRQDPGDVCRGQLAQGVAGHGVGTYSPAHQQPVQGDLEGEERGLGVLGPVELLRVRARHHRAQGCVQMRVEPFADGVQSLGEGGEGRVQLVGHARPLAALPGEEEGGALPCPVRAPDEAGGRLAGGEGRESAY